MNGLGIIPAGNQIHSALLHVHIQNRPQSFKFSGCFRVPPQARGESVRFDCMASRIYEAFHAGNRMLSPCTVREELQLSSGTPGIS